MTEEESKEAKEELMAAYRQCRKFSVFISDCCNFTKMFDESQNSKLIVASRGAGKAIRSFLEYLNVATPIEARQISRIDNSSTT
jgi:hypothetical protein